jgi:hypothetical protein
MANSSILQLHFLTRHPGLPRSMFASESQTFALRRVDTSAKNGIQVYGGKMFEGYQVSAEYYCLKELPQESELI